VTIDILSAIDAYARLVTAHATNLQWSFELSRTWNELGIEHELAAQANTTGHTADAEAHVTRAQALEAKLKTLVPRHRQPALSAARVRAGSVPRS
jgi:hypothetical protein